MMTSMVHASLFFLRLIQDRCSKWLWEFYSQGTGRVVIREFLGRIATGFRVLIIIMKSGAVIILPALNITQIPW